MTDIDVVWSADRRIAHILLNCPEGRNALDSAMLDRLAMAITEIRATPSRRLVLVESARERIFAVGAECHEADADAGIAAFGGSMRGQAIFDSLSRLEAPVIAVIDGPALGDGFELALACDVRIASSRGWFGLPKLHPAGGAGWGGFSRLVPLVGPARARDLLFTGKMIDADEAMAMGLLAAVHAPEQLAGAVADLTTQMLDDGRLPFQIGKQIIGILSRIPAPGLIERSHPLNPSPSALGEGERRHRDSFPDDTPPGGYAPLSRLGGGVLTTWAAVGGEGALRALPEKCLA